MTNKEKIEVISAYDRGETVELKTNPKWVAWMKHESLDVYEDWTAKPEPEFNFTMHDYRVKPKRDIAALAKEHGLNKGQLNLLTRLMNMHRRYGIPSKELCINALESQIDSHGDIQIGCQSFTYAEAEEYRAAQGMTRL